MARKNPADTPSETTPDAGTPAEKPKRTPRATAPKAPVAKTPAPKPVTPRKKPVPKPPTEDEATGKVDPKPTPEPEPDSTIVDDVNSVDEAAGGQTTASGNFGERILDTIFGFGVINAEVIERAANRLGEVVTDFPTYIAEVEAKGRPLREQLFGSMKFDFPTSTDVFDMADDADEPTGDGPSEDEPATPSTEAKAEEPTKPAEPAKPKAPAKPAEDEISALERRVRELEQQVDTDYEMEK
jgi:hypothetical protein